MPGYEEDSESAADKGLKLMKMLKRPVQKMPPLPAKLDKHSKFFKQAAKEQKVRGLSIILK